MTAGRVILKKRRARPFFARHPWVFESSIDLVTGAPAPGDEVAVTSQEGQFIARGLYNPASAIRVRLYRWDDLPLDESFWAESVARAVRPRHQILGLGEPGSAYRVVFSEGDGLSGLTVDRYDRWLVAQFTSLALHDRRELILRLLLDATGAIGVVARAERGVASREGLRAGEETTLGTVSHEAVAIMENGLTYEVGLGIGQKTGFYLDQRVNRLAVAGYCRGRRVLDLCCFTGGFALNALKHGGAMSALGVDSSAPAIEAARRHAAQNGISGAKFETGDALKVLERLAAEKERFEVVVCDPPKYAPRSKDIESAIKAYTRLNLAAVRVLEPGGVLVTCSCSSLIARELMFVHIIGSIAERSGRPIQVLEQRGQAPDHPVSASCPSTEYLKCLICRVGS